MTKMFSSFYHKNRNITIILSFFIISLLCMILILKNGSIGVMGDAQFHYQRLKELTESIFAGNIFPNLSNRYFNEIGSAVMTLYPYFTLIPFSIVLPIFKQPLHFFEFFFFMCYFIAFLSAYYSSYSFKKNRKVSYLFAVIYGTLSMNLFWQMDFGMQIAIAILPVSIFGFMNYLTKNKWLQLSFGMTLLLLTHIVSTLVTFLFILIWLLINYKSITKEKILILLKAVIVSLIAGSIYWIPALKIILMNRLIQPMNMFTAGGVSGESIFKDAFSPHNYISDSQFINFTVNGIALISVFLGIIYFKKFNKMYKQAYIISVIMILFYSSIFPWSLFATSFINIVQSPSRFYIIPQLILDYLFSVIVIQLINVNKLRSRSKMIIVILFCLLFQVLVQSEYLKQDVKNSNLIINETSMNQDFINSRRFSRFGNNDYFPIETNNDNIGNYLINNSDTNINGVQFKNMGNAKFKFIAPKNTHDNMVIPYLYYSGVNYEAYVNGKYVSVSSDPNKLMQLNDIPNYKGTITIKYNLGIAKVLGIFLSFLGVIIYFMACLKKYGSAKIIFNPFHNKK